MQKGAACVHYKNNTVQKNNSSIRTELLIIKSKYSEIVTQTLNTHTQLEITRDFFFSFSFKIIAFYVFPFQKKNTTEFEDYHIFNNGKWVRENTALPQLQITTHYRNKISDKKDSSRKLL